MVQDVPLVSTPPVLRTGTRLVAERFTYSDPMFTLLFY